MDLVAVREAAAKAVDRARSGAGPSFIECITYRFTGHSRGDPSAGTYRTREELQEWMTRDPLPAFAARAGLADRLDGMLEAADMEMDAAVEFARASSFPDLSVAFEDVYPSEVVPR
jgi:TPP-dependent pyruvate/acetoin dehydrogenase alpha subunit